MAAQKTKSAPANGATKTKGSRSTPASTGTTTPVPPSSQDTSEQAMTASGSGKPDKVAYDTEQDRIKSEIDALQTTLSTLKEKISLTSKSSSGNDRRTTLRAELDSIRGHQSTNKASRGKIFDQLKAIQDNIQKKVKDLQAAKSKIPYKSVAEVDAQIKHLEKQVESGNMKLVDERKALQEISLCKRNRRTVESFQAEQESIEADRCAADDLRKQLDNPESKAIAERYDAIKAELDELKKEGDDAYAGRAKLFEERDNLQTQLNILYNSKRESAQRFREANDHYWNKVNEDRARRAEKARAQRAADEAAKKLEIAERLKEEAALPAFQAQIEDCQTLIDYFAGKNSGNVPFANTPSPATIDVAGVPRLELRKVDAGPQEGLVVRKKKGEVEESYFVGKGKGKGKKSGTKGSDFNGTQPTSTSQLNVPLPILSALLSLSITPLASAADVPRVVEDLKTKKAWFEANQSRVTNENVMKAKADIGRLTGAKDASTGDISPSNGENPKKTTSSLQSVDLPGPGIPSGEVVEKSEVTQELVATDA